MAEKQTLNRPHLSAIRVLFEKLGKTLVIVDDDPTGTQTVHDVPVLGHWSLEVFKEEFERKTKLFFVLANTRSLVPEEAVKRSKEIGKNLLEASMATGRDFILVSRSDSTLRGHFPEEVAAISEACGRSRLPWIMAPVFFEGGRVTENDVHYIIENEVKIPVSQTPFAKDKSFGYQHADLRKWIMEKSKGNTKRDSIKSLSLERIRKGENLRETLATLQTGETLIINATMYEDLEIVCQALLQEIKEGRNFIFRTAASFISAFTGMEAKPWLVQQRPAPKNGGLMIVGSYVPKTTGQLQNLLSVEGLFEVCLPVEKIIAAPPGFQEWTRESINKIEESLSSGKHMVIYTSRTLLTGKDASENLGIGEKINDYLVNFVKSIRTKPSFIIAKGGITANDIAVKSLGMKRAMVAGQLLPGVPVWQLGDSKKFTNTPYVVFPGNVGNEKALKEAFEIFTQNPDAS
ncbi:four-carbon acid sugar kinase family protein [Negadavirga shengliensis]|uniref:Four-carbon acid sugar kinase family protein n=1 Tax=Negadavirga shengliensis TaxID=1389218 RepID=A0ABV9SXZ6_9BACT